jgi:replicative DNA helicase
MYDPALPPQNIEAEESILGGILLDPKAMGRIVDFLVADAFYVRSHQEIYRAAVSLHGKGKPTDLMTVSSWLQDHQLLDQVGGIPAYLAPEKVDRIRELDRMGRPIDGILEIIDSPKAREVLTEYGDFLKDK